MELDMTQSGSQMRADIDTSAPFESVKEAVSRFGGIGYWKPSQHNKLPETEHQEMDEVDISKLEDQAAVLERDLILKERETLDVLKELETTKAMVEELKSKLQKQASEANVTLESNTDGRNVTTSVLKKEKKNDHDIAGNYTQNVTTPVLKQEKKNNHEIAGSLTENEGLNPRPSSAPGLILMELKHAKWNLSKTTNELSDIRGSVEFLNKKLEKERNALEKTRERLTQNSSKIASLEEELNQTKVRLESIKETENKGGSKNSLDISKELQRLNSETEQFKKMGEAAQSEVLKAISEIQQTKSKIKTAEIRLVAARKMKQAARAAEAVALAEIKAISSHENSSAEKGERVTLAFAEYSSLTCKAREAEILSKTKVVEAMVQVDEANVSKTEILKKVKETTEEVKTSKKALEAALSRVEAANKGKLAVEEALRKWRSENGQKRRSSVNNSTKFKNSYPSQNRRESRLFDVNGLNLANDGPTPVLKPTLSIGQILSRKLLLPEELETEMLVEMKRKVSLGQMLGKSNGDVPINNKTERESNHKKFSGKRKKFGFARFSLLLTKERERKRRSQL